MKIENITIKSKNKNKLINIRITNNIYNWLKDKKYSPTAIFYEALKDLDCPYVK